MRELNQNEMEEISGGFNDSCKELGRKAGRKARELFDKVKDLLP